MVSATVVVSATVRELPPAERYVGGMSNQRAQSRITPFKPKALLPLGLVLLLGLLSACATYDNADNKYLIVITPENEEESVAPIGLFQLGETAYVTLEVTPSSTGVMFNATLDAEWELIDKDPEDYSEAFELTLSTSADEERHALTAVAVGQTNLCYTYQLPGFDTHEDCLFIMVTEDEE